MKNETFVKFWYVLKCFKGVLIVLNIGKICKQSCSEGGAILWRSYLGRVTQALR